MEPIIESEEFRSRGAIMSSPGRGEGLVLSLTSSANSLCDPRVSQPKRRWSVSSCFVKEAKFSRTGNYFGALVPKIQGR